jgi:hypothetical protein
LALGHGAPARHRAAQYRGLIARKYAFAERLRIDVVPFRN